MSWYRAEDNNSYQRITGKFLLVATKHRVLGGTKYFVAKPVFRWRDWWWHDINDNAMFLIYEDDMYSIFTPINF